jgi:rhodanese-related sulfurtransferase
MAPFPLLLTDLLGKFGAYLVFLAIGLTFGYVLESSGFNHSPTLAAQFYFKDLRVFKVFFTAIVVGMLMIFTTAALGILDYNLIWVNPTYLWSGIVGGLIMGVGFILGGFCPGTSLVALATLKLDGVFFVLGGLVGVFTFSETVGFFDHFFEGSNFGRLTLMEFFNLPTGVIVIGVTLMALFMLWGGEKLEIMIGKKAPNTEPKARYIGAGVFVVVAVAIALIGQPTTLDRWNKLAIEKQPQLEERVYQIHPGELLNTMHDHKINLVMLDVRSEADYNLFHLRNAQQIVPTQVPDLIAEFHGEPANTVFVVMSNDEAAATTAWKTMVAESVPNAYILDGGINGWLDIFAGEFEGEYCGGTNPNAGDDELRYDFTAALGSGCPAAYPDHEHFDLEYINKIKLEMKRAPSGGGCG